MGAGPGGRRAAELLRDSERTNEAAEEAAAASPAAGVRPGPESPELEREPAETEQGLEQELSGDRPGARGEAASTKRAGGRAPAQSEGT